VEEKLNDLKNLIIKYIPPEYDENVCNEFLLTLALFEKDLEDHARIENKILTPLVLEIEKNPKRKNRTSTRK
jgi:regulator of cell morphogenesis and NO signaling